MKTAPLLLALALVAANARATGHLADVEVIDRDTGAPVATHWHHGDCWVAGRPGGRYSIAIQSRIGERLLAVTSVDGTNVVSGETASVLQTGYVFGPYQSYQIDGWRKSDREVAAFTFTSPPDSYAARTGRGDSIGVVGVALFRERIARAPIVEKSVAEAGGARRDEVSAMASEARARGAAPAASAPQLGTGHGERLASVVDHTDFDRASTVPSETIRIRYDSFEHLVAMGVIRPTPAVPSRPEPFPASASGYVPDPPDTGWQGLR